MADGKGQQVTLYFRARDAAVIKKEIHQLAGGKYQVQQQRRRRRRRRRRGGGGRGGRCVAALPPLPLKYLCRMTSHFWNPAVYYKVLCTGTMTRAQTVTEATVITRKMVAAPVCTPRYIVTIDPRSRNSKPVKGARRDDGFVRAIWVDKCLPRSNYSGLRREIGVALSAILSLSLSLGTNDSPRVTR